MKTIVKATLAVAALAVSVGAFAHWGYMGSDYGHQQNVYRDYGDTRINGDDEHYSQMGAWHRGGGMWQHHADYRDGNDHFRGMNRMGDYRYDDFRRDMRRDCPGMRGWDE